MPIVIFVIAGYMLFSSIIISVWHSTGQLVGWLSREMSQRGVWSALCCCVGRTRFLCSFSFHMEPSLKKIERNFFFPRMSVVIFVLSTGVGQIESGPLTKYAFVSQNRVWLYGGGGVGNPFQHSLMHAHITLSPMARGLSYGTQGAAGVAPHTPLLGTIMASSGPAPVLRPVRRRFKLAILTVLSIHNPHQQCSKDEMQSWDSLSLARPYLILRWVECYISNKLGHWNAI